MELRTYVETLRGEFLAAAEAGGNEGRELAERLFTPFGAAIQLILLDALTDAADEITREIAPGSVHLRLRGREPVFVVSVPEAAGEPGGAPPAVPAPAPVVAPDGDEGGTSRINLRLPDHLKASVEEAAARAGLSVNAWLVRAAASAVGSGDPPTRPASKSGQHYTGWVR